jgi:3-isopropylmalate/(R)-2-methylmalate dehydratase small subunit
MEKYRNFNGVVAPINKNNIDTDTIIPKQYLKSISRTGFGVNLFDEWRYLDPGEPGQNHSKRQINKDFTLNKNPYNRASILLTGDNFGCGSSREHAAWAIKDFGIKAIIAKSFADIFYNNCFKNGILPIVLDERDINILYKGCLKEKEYKLTIDLINQVIFNNINNINNINNEIRFDIDPYRKEALLKGLDEIAQTLGDIDLIKNFEESHKKEFPWLF